MAGISTYLRDSKPNVVIGCADPLGAGMYHLFKDGEARPTDGSSIAEGIGLGRSTPIVGDLKIDYPYAIPDEEALPLVFDLAEQEGLLLGGSTAINMAGARRLAKDLGPGHTIVTILCDHGTRSQSKLYNPEFLRSRNLPVPAWLERHSTLKAPFI